MLMVECIAVAIREESLLLLGCLPEAHQLTAVYHWQLPLLEASKTDF